MTGIEDKVAVVTGAGRGIGRGIAIAYGRAGAKVVVASRTESTVDSVVAEIQHDGGSAIGITCDVGVKHEVFDMVDTAVKTFGTVNVLVNNAQSFTKAGKVDSKHGRQPIETFDEDDWEALYRTGPMATLWGMKAVFPHMKEHGGKIINFGSLAGQLGIEGFSGYGAAKEAIRSLSRTAAREWGKYKINVNVINPAVKGDTLAQAELDNPEFMSQMLAQIPLGRWGDPIEDAGSLAVFLASSGSDYLTGMTFMLDGGQYVSP